MKRQFLSLTQSARLVYLIESEWLSSQKNDADFARYASEKLGFPVSVTQVYGRRSELGIQPPAKTPESFTRLSALEFDFHGLTEAMFGLRDRLEKLESTCRMLEDGLKDDVK